MKIAEGIELDVSEYNRALGKPERPRPLKEGFGGIACPGKPVVAAVQGWSRSIHETGQHAVSDVIQREIAMLTHDLKGYSHLAQSDPSRGASEALKTLTMAMTNILHEIEKTDPKFKEVGSQVKSLYGKIPHF